EPPRVARFERAQEPRQGREQTDRFSATYTVGEDGALDLTQIAGDVRVTARPGDQVRIEAVKRVRHRDPDQARRLLEDLRVEVTQVGNRIEVRTAYPRRTNREWSGTVDYEITVPPPTAVSVKTVSGDVAVSGVT